MTNIITATIVVTDVIIVIRSIVFNSTDYLQRTNGLRECRQYRRRTPETQTWKVSLVNPVPSGPDGPT